jgi:tetratricopeptide (TPR) repeat protein
VKEIERHLSEGLQHFPENVYLLDAEAQLARLLRDSERVFETLKEAFKANPRNAFSATRLAICYVERGDHRKAKETLEQALDANPGDRRLRFAYGKLLMRAGTAPGEQVAYHLERAFTPGDENYDAQILYGRQLFINGDLDKSNALFRACGEARVGPELREALLYPLADRFRGAVAKIEASYCFIERDGFSDWVFAHRNDVDEARWGQVKLGLRVSFRIAFSLRGARAFDLQGEDEVTPMQLLLTRVKS